MLCIFTIKSVCLLDKNVKVHVITHLMVVPCCMKNHRDERNSRECIAIFDHMMKYSLSSAWWNSFHIFSLLLSHILSLSAASLLPLKNELLSQGFKLSLTSPWKQLNYKWFGANAIVTTQTSIATHTNFKKHLLETIVITVIVIRLLCVCDCWCLLCVFGGSALIRLAAKTEQFITRWPLLSHGPISFAM